MKAFKPHSLLQKKKKREEEETHNSNIDKLSKLSMYEKTNEQAYNLWPKQKKNIRPRQEQKQVF